MYNKGISYSTDPYNCTNLISVKGFDITAIEPVGSTQSVVFKIGVGGSWSKLNTDGTMVAIATQAMTPTSLLSEGNTLTEMRAITNIPLFVGKNIYMAAAMQCNINDVVMPSLTLDIKGTVEEGVLTKIEESDIVVLVPSGSILVNYFEADYTLVSGTILIEVSYLNNGIWSTYEHIGNVVSVMASSVKYRTTMTVNSIGGGVVTLRTISAVYDS